MIGWLYRTLWGCFSCKFVQVEKYQLYSPYDDDKQPTGTQYIMRCEKCGRMKKYTF